MTIRAEVMSAIRVDITACGTHRQTAGTKTYRAEAAKPRGVKKSTKNTVMAIVTGIQLSSRFASGGPNARLSCVRCVQHLVVMSCPYWHAVFRNGQKQ
jgi:hypothetical protein